MNSTNFMNNQTKTFAGFHLLFALVAGVTLLMPVAEIGWRLLWLVVAWNMALPIFAWGRGYFEWIRLWWFLVPLSALQLLPDWFLAAELGVLVFPDTGSPRIGPVPWFMAGMWSIPLLIVLYSALQTERLHGPGPAYAIAGLTGLILFAGAEASLWAVPVWHAQNVATVAHVAVYLLIPETLLGVAAYAAWRMTHKLAWRFRLYAAFTVMVFYMGNVALFHLLIERVLLR